MTDAEDRAVVRTAGRAARASLVGSKRASAEASLISHLGSLQLLERAESVGSFVAHDGEPDLTPLVEWLWHRGQRVALPVLEDDPDDRSMRFVPWGQTERLTAGRYGIPVPPPAPAVVPDVLLVSFTGFDSAGRRIGRGAGFFDRYLASYRGSVVGVGFEVQRFEVVPTNTHDVPLPVVVTDLGVRFVSCR